MTPLSTLDLMLSGVRLVEASAGTGKTYTITTLVLRLLLERELRIDQILIVTFTNAATAELRQRVRQRLGRALSVLEGSGAVDAELSALLERGVDRARARRLLTEAMCDLDEAGIFTIHGFCQRALAEHAFESGLRFDLELLADERSLVSEAVKDFWVKELYAASQAELQYLRRQGVDLTSFEYLARIALGWPELRVLPAAGDEGPTQEARQAALAEYLNVRDRAALVWPSCSERIEQLLSSPDLNRSVYRSANVPLWCHKLGEILTDTEPTLGSRFAQLVKFTPASLRQHTKARFTPPSHEFFELCAELHAASERAQSAFAGWLLGLQHKLLSHLPRELGRTKHARGVQSFDDLLQGLDRALHGARGDDLAARLARRYPAALIDEFQDTDPIQYRIFRRIYVERGALLLIGDPKQAIYAFRGADVFTYLRAARDAGSASTLEVNWRSDPRLIRAQNALFGRLPAAFLLPEIRYVPVKPPPDAKDRLESSEPIAPLQLLFVGRDPRSGKRARISKTWAALNLPKTVAAEVGKLFTSGTRLLGRSLAPGDVAVLTRTNRQALDVQQELRLLGIPSVLHGDASVLESNEAQELGYVLRALAEPNRSNAVRAALCTSLFGLSAAALHALKHDEAEWERWIDRFRSWHAIWVARGFVQAFRTLLHEQDVLARLLSQVSGERIATNVLHLVELLHQAAREEHLGVSGLLQWFDQVRFDQAAREGMAPEAMQIRLESDDLAVQLTTMHRSKGLEYPVVVCPYLWDGVLLRKLDRRYCRYHDPGSYEFTLSLVEDEDAAEAAAREARAENLRLCYVALTRAKHLCLVITGAFKNYEQSALAHLLHGPNHERRLTEAHDTVLVADLEALARDSEGAISVRKLGALEAPVYRPSTSSQAELVARTPSRRVLASFRNSSFSALTTLEGLLSGRPSHERDRDLPKPEIEPPTALLDGYATAAPAITLAEFPRGPVAGDALHWILEQLDFVAPEDAALDELIKQGLGRRGIPHEPWAGPVARALRETLATPLRSGDAEFRLGSITRSQRQSELEFLFPVSPRADGSLISPAELARVFGAHGGPELAAYAPELARLTFTPFTGFLRGFIDLVFERDGEWFVVDYKSNHLGSSHTDYGPDGMAAAMRGHHYYLQYHLYVLALHRHLERRLVGYAYERNFGGAYYLFLRGMSPRHGATSGVFYDRPPLALIDALSAALGGTPEDGP